MPMLLPPREGTCPICGVVHEPLYPHNAQSLYYQYRFFGVRGRWPTWADAIAHCTPEMQADWKAELTERGVWTEPAGGAGGPIADPPLESFSQPIQLEEGPCPAFSLDRCAICAGIAEALVKIEDEGGIPICTECAAKQGLDLSDDEENQHHERN